MLLFFFCPSSRFLFARSHSLADQCPFSCYCNFPLAILHHNLMKSRKVGLLPTGGGSNGLWRLRLMTMCILDNLKRHIFILKWMSTFVVSFTENTFCSGDHVSWHSPLDNSESRIQHMLLTEDPQMQPVQTPFGSVSFLQVSSTMWYSLWYSLLSNFKSSTFGIFLSTKLKPITGIWTKHGPALEEMKMTIALQFYISDDNDTFSYPKIQCIWLKYQTKIIKVNTWNKNLLCNLSKNSVLLSSKMIDLWSPSVCVHTSRFFSKFEEMSSFSVCVSMAPCCSVSVSSLHQVTSAVLLNENIIMQLTKLTVTFS